MAKDSFMEAVAQPIFRFPETMHELFWGEKANFKSAYKATDLIWSGVDVLKTAFPETFPTFTELGKSLSTFKNIGKLIEAEGIGYAYREGGLSPSAPDDIKHPLVKLDHIYKPVYVIKIAALTMGIVAQTFLICKKYVHPQFFSKVSETVVKNTGLIAARIGGTNIQAVARFVTSAGLLPIKHLCLIVFLSIDAFQCIQRFRKDDITCFNGLKKHVYHELKSIENISKVVVISMCLFGFSTPLIAGTGLVVSFFSVASLYQKGTMPKPPPTPAPAEHELVVLPCE